MSLGACITGFHSAVKPPIAAKAMTVRPRYWPIWTMWEPPWAKRLKFLKLTRLEVHGPAAEIEKLRAPMAGLNPQFFVLAEGSFRR